MATVSTFDLQNAPLHCNNTSTPKGCNVAIDKAIQLEVGGQVKQQDARQQCHTKDVQRIFNSLPNQRNFNRSFKTERTREVPTCASQYSVPVSPNLPDNSYNYIKYKR